jgi:hypothetical protein
MLSKMARQFLNAKFTKVGVAKDTLDGLRDATKSKEGQK